MENGLLGFMDMIIVLAFALGWGILELVARSLDKKRTVESSPEQSEKPTGDMS